MKIPKLKKNDIIEIIWCDTHTPTNPSWMTESEHEEWTKTSGSMVKSVGIFISLSDDFYHLVGDTEYGDVMERSFLRPINIARGFIKKIRVLK